MILKQTMICKCMLQEAKVFKELVLTDTAKGLVHTFFAQRMTSKVLFFISSYLDSSLSHKLYPLT